jgi:HlyD family secretion protein
MRKLIVLVLILAAAVAGFLWWRSSKKAGAEARFRTEKVDKGNVVATVSASGTLNAVTTVNVGSQVSGLIARLHADFNSEVKKGQLLAEIDPLPFQATVDQRRADVARQRIDLRNSELQFVRAKSLYDQQLLSKAEYDIAQATRDGAAASVRQSEAALQQSEANLSYTRIASPISGVVVARQIDVGQTVAASFQAPTLFTIAQDLTKMQVLTNIDEADIGRVREGQKAVFSVDAFPDGSFSGQVSQIRLSPQTVQNVVTYPVLLDVANPEGRLRPGMTANVQIPVDSGRRPPCTELRCASLPPEMLVARRPRAPRLRRKLERRRPCPGAAGEKKPDEISGLRG